MLILLILFGMILVNLFVFNPMIYNSINSQANREDKFILFWVGLIFPPLIFGWGILLILYMCLVNISKNTYKIYSNNIDRKFWK